MAALLAYYLFNKSGNRAIQIGILAAIYAFLPDIDLVHSLLRGIWKAVYYGQSFEVVLWQNAEGVHRIATHSIIVILVAGIIFYLSIGSKREKTVATLAGVTVFLMTYFTEGYLLSSLVAVFLLAGALFSGEAKVRGFSRTEILGAAYVGMFSQTYGDLFTHGPPRLLFPLDYRIIESYIIIHPSSGINFMLLSIIEALTVIFALYVYFLLSRKEDRTIFSSRPDTVDKFDHELVYKLGERKRAIFTVLLVIIVVLYAFAVISALYTGLSASTIIWSILSMLLSVITIILFEVLSELE